VFWERRLLKVGGEGAGSGAGSGAGAIGAALFLICPLSVRKSRTRDSWPLYTFSITRLTWLLKEGWEMRRGKQPFSPVCVFWVRRLLKVGGEGAGAGAGATGALYMPSICQKEQHQRKLAPLYL
jgi:hypothetical protein